MPTTAPPLREWTRARTNPAPPLREWTRARTNPAPPLREWTRARTNPAPPLREWTRARTNPVPPLQEWTHRMTTCEHWASRRPDDRMPPLIWATCITLSRPTTSIIWSPISATQTSVFNGHRPILHLRRKHLFNAHRPILHLRREKIVIK